MMERITTLRRPDESLIYSQGLSGSGKNVKFSLVACLGAFESGLAARLFGTVGSVVGGGIGTVLVVLCVAAIWPNVSSLGSLQDVDTSKR